jgi:hypothetical protein
MDQLLKLMFLVTYWFKKNIHKRIAWSSYYKNVILNGDKVTYYCSNCCVMKRSNTNQIRYNNSTLHGNRQEIIQNIFIEKYGDHPMKCDYFKEKLKSSNMKKYGVDNP